MKKYDVVIVGAGPAGLFCAYELIEKNNLIKLKETMEKKYDNLRYFKRFII